MSSRAEWKLDPQKVRQCAKSIKGCREVPTLGDSVVSFLVGLDRPGNKEPLARINVYFQTGTVGTCRVLDGQVREVFRRNVGSIEVLKRILTQPPHPTNIGDTLVAAEELSTSKREERQTLPAKLELAEVGVCILMGEREKLEHHLEDLRKEDHSEDSEQDDGSGMDFEFSLPDDVVHQVEQCLQDITDMGRHVTCVGTNGKGAVFLYGHGGVAFTPNIPKPLYHKLKQLKGGGKDSVTRPSYVALGTRDRYYIAFHDGSADWRGPKGLDKSLKQRAKNVPPRSVAFGSTYDTYFIVFDDGSWEYQGRGIPDELQDKLADRADRADLVCVTLGPKGEWFLRAQNGRLWWGGTTEELDTLMQGLLESDRYLNVLDFGEDGSYFISYD